MGTREEHNAIDYKYECRWNSHNGWHFSFGDMRMWEGKNKYIVARLVENEQGEGYVDHQQFLDMSDALDYMRTGDKSKATGKGPKR